MRKYLLLLLLFVTTSAMAQPVDTSDTPVVLKQLTKEGVLLNKGWKFLAGDNPAYADPLYDDSKWQSIDPTKDIFELPQLWKGISWFRLKIYLDSTVQSQPLALAVQQSGASEVFINGKLLHRFGNVSSEADKIVAYNPLDKPLPLQFAKSGENVLAIRHRLQPHICYTRIEAQINPVLLVTLNKTENTIDFYQRESARTVREHTLWFAVYLLLFILHGAFYMYYPLQKANLFFLIYAALNFLGIVIETYISHEVKDTFYQMNASADFGQMGNFFLLSALYVLLNQKRAWVYWTLLVLTVLGLVLNAVVYIWGFAISSVIINTLINLETVRIAFKAVKSKQRGAWLIATGALNFFVFWCLFLYLALTFGVDKPFGETLSLGDLLYDIAFLSIPFSTSVFLGLDFAFTSRSLQQKLVEVNELAERNLAQEQEKQQILASQKELLEQQVTERTAQLNQSLHELKATQAQLVQREKMASLGELTAGIAHEIQNPLNFVNNFSEINKELITELKHEVDNDNLAEVKAIAEDIGENQEKINHHGRRAEAIVKGMLQHSRANTGEKEPTDINSLVEEYLRLSYHGLRAKDKSFEVQLQTEFDGTIGQVNIVPQDLGRVLLNLFNNAFYATMTKKKLLNGTYEPVVTIRTRRTGDKVEIQVTDNGTGIPKMSLDKIFQPFFTTKPTGEGTGLGLSLSYDIITKGHGGELIVESREGEGAMFVIKLPI